MLKANEGRIMNTVINKSLMRISLNTVSRSSGPEPVRMTRIPSIPKAIDE